MHCIWGNKEPTDFIKQLCQYEQSSKYWLQNTTIYCVIILEWHPLVRSRTTDWTPSLLLISLSHLSNSFNHFCALAN